MYSHLNTGLDKQHSPLCHFKLRCQPCYVGSKYIPVCTPNEEAGCCSDLVYICVEMESLCQFHDAAGERERLARSIICV